MKVMHHDVYLSTEKKLRTTPVGTTRPIPPCGQLIRKFPLYFTDFYEVNSRVEPKQSDNLGRFRYIVAFKIVEMAKKRKVSLSLV